MRAGSRYIWEAITGLMQYWVELTAESGIGRILRLSKDSADSWSATSGESCDDVGVITPAYSRAGENSSLCLLLDQQSKQAPLVLKTLFVLQVLL